MKRTFASIESSVILIRPSRFISNSILYAVVNGYRVFYGHAPRFALDIHHIHRSLGGLLSWTRRGAPWEESFTRRTAVLACFRGNRKQAPPKFYWRAIVSHKAGGSPLLRSARGIYQRVSRYLGPRPPLPRPRVSLSRAFVAHSAIGLD